MQRSLYTFLFCFCLGLYYSTPGHAQTANRVQESLVMPSQLLSHPVKYSIYLPPDYYTSNKRYPVVYLLHGYSDNETAWLQFGETDRQADKAISSGEIPPMIIVMPDAGITWYMNDYQGKERYEDMFIKEFIPYIDAQYRTRTQKEFRAVSGLSMGGHGALLLAMHNPSLFTACAAFSSGIMTDEGIVAMPDNNYDPVFTNLVGNKPRGKARLTEHWQKNNPLNLAKTLPADSLKKVRWYLDCGDQDFLYEGNAMMHITLRKREIPHEFRVRAGAHEWIYWRTGLIPALQFIGASFNR